MSEAATKSYKSFNTLKQYVSLDTTDYWHIQYPWTNGRDQYFWDMSQKAFDCKLERDDNGITLYLGEDGNTYYSMIEVAQYGMASFQAFKKTGKKHWLKESIKHASFLIDQGRRYKGSDWALVNEYPISLYDLNEEWVSSLAYGVSISLWLRLYEETGDEKYLESALKLGENYNLEIESGGIKRAIETKNLVIFEEYPSEKVSGVLNGHITALWGIYDLGLHESKFKILFQERVNELAQNISSWDANYWSYYDLKHTIYGESNLSSIHYHMLHVKQLMVLYQLSGLAAFADFCEKCIRNKYSIKSRIKAFLLKSLFRIKKDYL